MSETPYSVLDVRNPCYAADRCTLSPLCEQHFRCIVAVGDDRHSDDPVEHFLLSQGIVPTDRARAAVRLVLSDPERHGFAVDDFVAKDRWRIVRASCNCGGRWAWMRQRPGGGWVMAGCVCHHPWTLVTRW